MNRFLRICAALICALARFGGAGAEGSAGPASSQDPVFDWDSVPTYGHTQNSASNFTDLDIAWLADNYSFVTIEKAHGRQLYGTADVAFTMDAARLRQRNPALKVLFYLNISIAYTFSHTAILSTYGEPAWVSAHPDWVLRDTDNQPILQNGRYRYNLANTNVQDWWTDIASNMCATGGADGIFVDALFQVAQAQAAGGAQAQINGAVAMLKSLREKAGTNKFLLGNSIRRGNSNTPLYMPYLDGGTIEHFLGISSTNAADYIKDIDDLKYWGKQGKVVVAKGWPGFSWLDAWVGTAPHDQLYAMAVTNLAFPLAAFLCGVQTNGYFSYSWGYTYDDGWFDYYPDLYRLLGPPQGDYVRTGNLFKREFAHAWVEADVEAATGRITWRSPRLHIVNPTKIVGNVLVLGVSNAMAGYSYSLLSSTNLGLTSSNWPVVRSGLAEPTNVLFITNVINRNERGQFFRLRVP